MTSYKRGQDTHNDDRAESASWFVPDQSGGSRDPNPGASWNTDSAAFHATTWDVRLEADGKSLTTRAKAGPANSSSQEAGGGI